MGNRVAMNLSEERRAEISDGQHLTVASFASGSIPFPISLMYLDRNEIVNLLALLNDSGFLDAEGYELRKIDNG